MDKIVNKTSRFINKVAIKKSQRGVPTQLIRRPSKVGGQRQLSRRCATASAIKVAVWFA